ncbi:MAG: PA14 domain-containing protein [Patescibacteria group bacterium]|jgi:fibro-slime domain-containing protein
MYKRSNACGRIFIGITLLATLASGMTVRAETTPVCDKNIVQHEKGFYGQYYNMAESDPGIQGNIYAYTTEEGPNNYWYGKDYFVFSRVDQNINFGDNFMPVNTGKAGDPFHFATHWRSGIVVPTTGTYTFKVTANNDAWLYIDGNLLINLGNSYRGANGTKDVSLTEGVHELNIYFAERSRPYSVFKFDAPTSLYYAPLPPGCSVDDVPLTGAPTPPAGSGTNNDSTTHGTVLGASTTGYTPAVALFKTAESPAVYAIYANGYRHYITSPTAFEKYDYHYNQIKTVSQTTLDRYPESRLVRTPEDATIYFIYTRKERQWLKINMPSPTAFVSYPQNQWGNVAVVDALDINAYPNANLIKTDKDPGIYLLQDNQKRLFLSADVFNALDYSWSEIVTVSTEHLNSYATGSPIG